MGRGRGAEVAVAEYVPVHAVAEGSARHALRGATSVVRVARLEVKVVQVEVEHFEARTVGRGRGAEVAVEE